MKILITGNKGFIGSRLQDYCEKQGHIVIGRDLPAYDITEFTADMVPMDWDVCVHLAAMAREADCRGRMQDVTRTNILGTTAVYDACVQRGVKQFVFASSEWVYDYAEESVKDEDDPLHVENAPNEYALSKMVSELQLRMLWRQTRMPTSILRFGIVYGKRPGNWCAVESLFDQVRTKDEVNVGSLLTSRSFIHVDDLTKGIAACFGKPGFNTWNLQGPDVVMLGDIIHTAMNIHRRWPKIRDTGAEPSVRRVSNLKAMSELHWQPTITLEEGLRSLL